MENYKNKFFREYVLCALQVYHICSNHIHVDEDSGAILTFSEDI